MADTTGIDKRLYVCCWFQFSYLVLIFLLSVHLPSATFIGFIGLFANTVIGLLLLRKRRKLLLER